jgi:hypothetical protein
MAERDVQLGIMVLLVAAFFLFSGLDMFGFRIVEPEFGTLIAFVLVGIGVYLVTKK